MPDTEHAPTVASPGPSAAAPKRDADDLTGQDLAGGRYTLLEVIGRGGMGIVYRAQHNAIGKTVAIKVLDERYAKRPDWVERFVREARATSKVDHENVIDIADCGTTPSGSAFIAMELLEGESFADTIEREGPLPWLRSKTIILQVCRALHAAHTRGVIHRDIKPDNCHRIKRGSNRDFVKVLDFGLIKHVEAAPHGTMLTMQGVTAGTPGYMAPEIALGNPGVDGRADLYSLACVAYFMLTGQPVFTGDTPVATVLAHVQAVPAPPSARSEFDVPAALDAVILECLSKEPAGRPASATALAERLAAAVPDDGWTAEHARAWWDLHRVSTPVVPADRSSAAPVEGAATPEPHPRCWVRFDRRHQADQAS